MTKRTKIERVGGHLLIEGGSYTGEDNCQEEVALPVATLRVENRNARSVFICVVGDPINVPNVIAHGWTAREVLEVAYGGGEWLYHPKPTDETRALVDQINALVEAGTEEIELLRARVAELERDARIGAAVRAEVSNANTYGHVPALDLDMRAAGARTRGDYAIGYLLRAIADALRAEEGGEQ